VLQYVFPPPRSYVSACSSTAGRPWAFPAYRERRLNPRRTITYGPRFLKDPSDLIGTSRCGTRAESDWAHIVRMGTGLYEIVLGGRRGALQPAPSQVTGPHRLSVSSHHDARRSPNAPPRLELDPGNPWYQPNQVVAADNRAPSRETPSQLSIVSESGQKVFYGKIPKQKSIFGTQNFA